MNTPLSQRPAWSGAPLVVLVRHCLPSQDPADEANEDRGLSRTGRRQAEQTATRLADELADVPARVLSSPYRRCMETAAPIAGRLGVTAAVEQRLTEARRGATARPEAVRAALARPWGLDRLPGAEPWPEVFARSGDLLRSLDHTSVPVLVTHETNIHMLCASWLGLQHADFAAPAYFAWFGSISVLRAGLFGQGALELLGDCRHLSDLPPPTLASRYQTIPRTIEAFPVLDVSDKPE